MTGLADGGDPGLLPTSELDLLARLVRASGAGEGELERVVAGAMEDVGCSVDRLVYDPREVPLIDEFADGSEAVASSQTCLVGSIGPTFAEEGARSLILFAHPDVEACPEDHGWSRDPRQPHVAGGRLSGWGVADDLCGLAIMIASIGRLRQRGWSPPAPVHLVCAPSKRHRRGIAAVLASGLSADAAIYLHPAESGVGLNEIKAFAPGQLEFSVELLGRPPETNEPSHAAFAHQALHPLTGMRKVLDALEGLDAERASRVRHPLLHEAIGRSTNILVTQIAAGSDGASARVPHSCRITAVVSLVPGERLGEVGREVEEAVVGSLASEAGWEGRFTVEWLSGVSAAETDQDSELYRLAEKLLRSVGANPRVNPLHTSSDIRNPIVQKSIPTIGYGPRCGNLTMAGRFEEWVDLQDVGRTISATVAIVAEWTRR